MTQLAQPSIENAPRDQQQLVRLGRFQLRKLAEQLGIINNLEDPASQEARVSFMGMNTEDQARTVLTQLQAVDASGGAPQQQAAPVQTAPAQAAPQQAPAATNGASNGLGGGLRRTPVNKDTAPTQTQAVATTPASTQASAPVSIDLSAVLITLGQILENQKALLNNQKELSAQVAALQTQVGVSTSVALLVGEEMVKKDGISRQDILEQAITDMDAVNSVISEATKVGKGKKGK